MTRTRTAQATDTTQAPAKKTAAKKTAAKRTTAASPRPARKPRTRKATPGAPTLSLVKPRKPLPTRELPFMTDVQGYATLASRIAGINTLHIRDWRDHRNQTATRRLRDGSILHYNLDTRTLTWQAVCPMGATHAYTLTSPSTAAAARVHADRCNQPHADLSNVKRLTADELEALGLLQTPTWANRLPGEPATESIPVALPAAGRARALGDALTRSAKSTEDTQSIPTIDVAADTEQPKEHPEHA
jgi:hypothetical protein